MAFVMLVSRHLLMVYESFLWPGCWRESLMFSWPEHGLVCQKTHLHLIQFQCLYTWGKCLSNSSLTTRMHLMSLLLKGVFRSSICCLNRKGSGALKVASGCTSLQTNRVRLWVSRFFPWLALLISECSLPRSFTIHHLACTHLHVEHINTWSQHLPIFPKDWHLRRYSFTFVFFRYSIQSLHWGFS